VITVDDVRAARFQAVCFMDGQGFYEQHYRCIEFPALVKTVRGPRGRQRHYWPEGSAGQLAADAVKVTYYVHGHALTNNTLVDIAEALTAPMPEGAPNYVDPIPHTRAERIGV
jgi:hypothetical protein